MAALYLDSNIVIALVEATAEIKVGVAARLEELGGREGRCVVSDLVRLECRVKPIATGDTALLVEYDGYFASRDVSVVALLRPACDRATHIRARYGFGALDALHLAAAVEAGMRCVRGPADRDLAKFSDTRAVLVTPGVV